MPISLSDIRSQAIRYLARESTLEEFYKWFSSAAVSIGQTEDSELRRLVDAVDGLFMRLSDHELAAPDFEAQLRQLAGVSNMTVTFVMSDDYPTTPAYTSLSSNATEEERTLQSA